MFTKYVLPLLAVAGLGFAIFTVVEARQVPPAYKPAIPPPTRPKAMKSIAGAGLVEARMENIPIGAPVPGVVTELFVKIGQKVKEGDRLFQIDDRELKAELIVRQAALASAEAELKKLQAAPRPEDIPPAEAAVAEAEARLADAEAALSRSDRLYQRQMVPAGDYDKDRFAYLAAQANLDKARADLAKVRAGTWEADLEIARAGVLEARSQVERTQINLDRLCVRALSDGEVLQVNVRPGQYAAIVWKEPLIVLGDVNTLHVRVDIDENDLPMFEKGAEAVATLKGRPMVRFPLEFVKVEPYVIPKRSLTGDNSERVDTRVLQVVYALPEERPVPVYVGQQMDVYLKAAETPADLQLDMSTDGGRPFDADATED